MRLLPTFLSFLLIECISSEMPWNQFNQFPLNIYGNQEPINNEPAYPQCLNVTDPNNWTYINTECLESDYFVTDKVWDLSSVPSTFDLTRFLMNKVTITASIRMVDTSLEALKFGKGIVSLGKTDGLIVISGNKRLTTLIGGENVYETRGNLTIKYNPLLSPNDANAICYKYLGSQDCTVGDCFFKTIQNLTDITFKDCDYAVIEGDLIIKGKKNFLGTNTVITKIGGCLIVKDTQLTLLDFIQLDNLTGSTNCIESGGKSEIVNNYYLCLSRKDTKNLQKWFPGIIISNNENCTHICSAEEVVNDKITGCKVVFGNVHLPKNTTRYIESLETVEELNGRLIIEGTQYESIQFLKKLKAIYTDSTDPTVFIKGNPQLHSINFSSMAVIGSSADLLLSALENQRFILSRDEFKLWVKLARGRKQRIRVKRDQTEDADGWQILGICLTCLFVLLYLVTSVLSFFTIRPDKRKKKKE